MGERANREAVNSGSAKATSHPPGLYTLFFTELWERFSYYGMRALLVLFLVDATRGGMALSDEVATAIYGLYTAGVYLAALPGGWIADRLWGARKAVWIGGIIIAAGHFLLALPGTRTFFLGLVLIVLGTGLLKPNISALVGQLYPEGGARRDAGFTIFYMGINIGAALGPLVCSTLGEKYNWHWGFAAAGVGMVLGLVVFRAREKHLGAWGLPPAKESTGSAPKIFALGLGITLLLLAFTFSGVIRFNPVALARQTAGFIATLGLLFFVAVYFLYGLDSTEKKRLRVIFILFISSAIFWAGFEQSGSSFNLFAERYTMRTILGWEAPAGWFQSLGPVLIISLAPLMALLWIRLAQRKLEPSLPAKFGWALIFLAGGFAAMAIAALRVGDGNQVWPTWLMSTYLLHTIGELCLSPVGLSSVTKLSPPRLVGQMMGSWFLATSLGNMIAGLVAGSANFQNATQLSAHFWQIVWMPLIAGCLLMVFSRQIKSWMAGVK